MKAFAVLQAIVSEIQFLQKIVNSLYFFFRKSRMFISALEKAAKILPYAICKSHFATTNECLPSNNKLITI